MNGIKIYKLYQTIFISIFLLQIRNKIYIGIGSLGRWDDRSDQNDNVYVVQTLLKKLQR